MNADGGAAVNGPDDKELQGLQRAGESAEIRELLLEELGGYRAQAAKLTAKYGFQALPGLDPAEDQQDTEEAPAAEEEEATPAPPTSSGGGMFAGMSVTSPAGEEQTPAPEEPPASMDPAAAKKQHEEATAAIAAATSASDSPDTFRLQNPSEKWRQSGQALGGRAPWGV